MTVLPTFTQIAAGLLTFAGIVTFIVVSARKEARNLKTKRI